MRTSLRMLSRRKRGQNRVVGGKASGSVEETGPVFTYITTKGVGSGDCEDHVPLTLFAI